MTDAKTRALLVDLSVIATAALVLGGSALVVAEVDSSRRDAPSLPETVSYALMPEPATQSRPAAGRPAAGLTGGSALTTVAAGITAPAPGLVPAPRPQRRRVVVVRRSRAS